MLTSTELNYLIWRYLQESGLELSAFALQDETKIDQVDPRYRSKIPIGTLVNLIQKGLFFSQHDKIDNLQDFFQDKLEPRQSFPEFTLLGALHKDSNPIDNGLEEVQKLNGYPPPQVKILQKHSTFPPSNASEWNPLAPTVLAWGQHDNTGRIRAMSVQASGQETTITLHHPETNPSEITCVSWSPQGHTLVTGSERGEICLWSADGKLRNILSVHQKPVLFLRWNKQGTFLISADTGNTAIIWNPSAGSPVRKLFEESSTQFIYDCCWINEFRFAISTHRKRVGVFEIRDPKPFGVLTGHDDIISGLSYSERHQLLLTWSDDATIRVWKSNTTNSSQILMGHSQPVSYCAWLDRETPFVVSCSLDGSARVWDVSSGETVGLCIAGEGFAVLEACLSPTKKKLLTADSNGGLAVWDVSSDFDKVQRLICLGRFETKSADSLVSRVSWNSDSTKVCASYNASESVVLNV